MDSKICDCIEKELLFLNNAIYTMTQSYRLLVGGAEEFSRIGLAPKHDKEEAIDRADDLGDVLDKLIKRIDHLTKLYLTVCQPELICLPKKEPIPNNIEFTELETEVQEELETEVDQNLEAEFDNELSSD